jgi:hypothetical protein
MTENENEITTISVKRRTSSRFSILQKLLGFHSADELLEIIVDLIIKKGWSKLDLECLMKYGKIPQVETGSARNENEMYEKLGFKRYTQTDKIKGKVKKPEKEKKAEKE